MDRAKLPQLLELKYHDIRDAVTELGTIATINEVLLGFSNICTDKTAQLNCAHNVSLHLVNRNFV